MPTHDWTRVDPSVFHDFRHSWIVEIARSLEADNLPSDYYAMIEAHAARFDPEDLILQATPTDEDDDGPPWTPAGVQTAPPRARFAGETDLPHKQDVVAVRHVSGDRIVAMVEVVSPGNKSTMHALRSFVEKAAELLDRRIHLLILDLLPPGPRDPRGIHGAIWEEVAGQEFVPPEGEPLTLAAYESALTIRAYVEPVAVGAALPAMPLFLVPCGHVVVPLEATYQDAWEAVPRRWRRVLEAGA